MNSPRRFSEAGTPAERALLGAAEQDRLSPAAKERIAAALGVGMTIGAGVSFASGAAKAGKLVAFKVLLALAIGGGLVAASSRYLRGSDSVATGAPAPNPPAPTADTPPVPVVVAPSATAAEPPAPPVPEASTISSSAAVPAPPASDEPPRPRPTFPAPPATAKTPSLAEEVAALEAVRAALARRDASGALSALGRYERDFPRRSLGQEAATLRIEALLQRGERAAALALAKRLLDTDRTYEARMRTLFPELATR